MNKAAFYEYLRNSRTDMFPAKLSESQVRGIEGILDAFWAYGDGRIKTLAYGLATARREVGVGMVPVREGFKKTDAAARAHVRLFYGHKGADWYCWPSGPHGHVYYGRGYVQMTWFENYNYAEHVTGLDFTANPDLALDPGIAGRLLFMGLLSGQWNRKGHGIAHYLPDFGADDLMNARRTVNITDHWQEIAGHYREFLAALEAADFLASVVDITTFDDAAPVFVDGEIPAGSWGADDAAFEDAKILALPPVDAAFEDEIFSRTLANFDRVTAPLGVSVPADQISDAARAGEARRALTQKRGIRILIAQIWTIIARVLAGLKKGKS